MSKRGSYIGGSSLIYPSCREPETFGTDQRDAPTWEAIQARKAEWAEIEMRAKRTKKKGGKKDPRAP